ncbi:MAG: hypothetical protein U0441_18300 [Polyangiaceae bacterium]
MKFIEPKLMVLFRKIGAPILAVVALLTTWIWYAGCLDREISDLPEGERQALYQRTLATLRQTCSESPGPAMTDYCREQAELIQHFPECDEDCHLLARRFLHVPAR